MDEVLSPEEARVLGSLIEKELATPEHYPLTLNALRAACNQSSSRNPVVSYGDGEVSGALGSLRERGMTRIVYSPSNRAPKYRHVVDESLGLDRPARALLGLLLLRGPQTVGELRTRSERLSSFDSLEEVESVLDALASRPDPLVVRLARGAGQKESRFAQVLTGPPDPDWTPSSAGASPASSGLASRVEALEAEVTGLREELAGVRAIVEELRGLLD